MGLNVSCKTLLAPGEIAVVPPIYPPFTEAPENMERGLVKTYLKDVNGRLEFDFDEIKNLLSEDTKMFFSVILKILAELFLVVESRISKYLFRKGNHRL